MYLGSVRERGEPLKYNGNHLTTHGVIVGMTGSGKTGLGFNLIEEALLNSIPVLVLDPKGDMGNLLLAFPDFAPKDFERWVDPGEARQEGLTVTQLAEAEAAKLQKRMASAGIGAERMRSLSDKTEMTIYTPGSSAGVSLNVLGSLAVPTLSWDQNSEVLRDEIEAFVSSLLILAGIDADPVSSREHILLSTIIESYWKDGKGLELATLVGLVPKPPFRKLGVFDVDAFFPEKDRTKLAMSLNGVLASPSFGSWIEGAPLDIEAMLGGDPTRAAIVYLAHLSEQERQFAVTLLLSKLVTWFRSQSGSEGLRALVYMDEAYGYAPPTAEPPSKKPILTILKQARAFGVGMILATQNPVDLDYKALSNAGTWFIGRLQTENDKRRMLEGLAATDTAIDSAGYSELISTLGKREFVLHSTKEKTPIVFKARRSMSYRAGPFTREQVASLMSGREATGQAAAAVADQTADAPDLQIDPDTVPVAPTIADGVVACFLDPAAPWGSQLGADPEATRYEPAIAVSVGLLYDDTAARLSHTEQYEAVLFPLEEPIDAGTMIAVDHDARDFLDHPSRADASFALTGARLHAKSFWTSVQTAVRDHLVAHQKVTIYKNSNLKLYSRVGETEDDFAARCREVAEMAGDEALVKLKQRYQTRIDRVKGSISKAENRVRDLSSAAASKGQEELIAGAGDLLGALLGGRRSSNPLGRAAKRRSATSNAQAKVDAAAEGLAASQQELIDLEGELAAEIEAITDGLAAQAEEVTPLEIPLEKTDVRVTDIRLVWIPRSQRGG